MNKFKRIVSLFLCFVILLLSVSSDFIAYASGPAMYGVETLWNWISGNSSEPLGGWNPVTYIDKLFSCNQPQKYYTTPTSSVQDKYGNVTNYYRGGDTTTTSIIDSYNQTFNTIHNTTNNTTTNNYKANVKLENFLNQYTTNNNNYTYSADFKSWYYDNTTNNYNYTTNNLYYNQDNSKYYLTIDNSTDEYYLIDVQYSPTFVTVNYTYNTTNINNTENVGDVTNVYYYELKDSRNSSSLTAAEVAGLDLGYDVVNYELVTDDPNTLSLQHFDGDYTDSSSYNRDFYSENRSTTYVDSGAFGQALKLPAGAAAGVKISEGSSWNVTTIDFRVYFDDISSLHIYLGDTNFFRKIPASRSKSFTEYYSDNGNTVDVGELLTYCYNSNGASCSVYDLSSISNVELSNYGYSYSNTLSNSHTPPTASDSGWSVSYSSKYGLYNWGGSISSPVVSSYRFGSYLKQNFSTKREAQINGYSHVHQYYHCTSNVTNYRTFRYEETDVTSIPFDFNYASYKNQWVSMRILSSHGYVYLFVNGDCVGWGAFDYPDWDKVYIKSSGTVYLDERYLDGRDPIINYRPHETIPHTIVVEHYSGFERTFNVIEYPAHKENR